MEPLNYKSYFTNNTFDEFLLLEVLLPHDMCIDINSILENTYSYLETLSDNNPFIKNLDAQTALLFKQTAVNPKYNY